MTPRLPAAVLWDFDGTLVDSETNWEHVEASFARDHGVDLPDGFHAAHIGGSMAATAIDLKQLTGTAASLEEIAEQLWDRAIRLLAEGPIPWQPGALDLVESLRALGIPQALVSSSGRRYLDVVLNRLEGSPFLAVISGDDVTRHKPHPEPYVRALKALSVRAADTVVIEDSPTGVASAVAAGCGVLVVPSLGTFEPAPRLAVCRSLADVTDADLSALLPVVPTRRQPEQQPPPVQWLALRYCKRGRARFTSHQDFGRAFERALRRASIPMAYSSGFNPHPRVSYANASATGAATEADYLEIGLAERRDPDAVVAALSEALPDGLDILSAVESTGRGLGDRLTCSHWIVDLVGPGREVVDAAVAALLGADDVMVERLTKNGVRRFDARGAVRQIRVIDEHRLELWLEHRAPMVRPDDIVQALEVVDPGFVLAGPAMFTRLAQGVWRDGTVEEPFGVHVVGGTPSV